MEDKKCLVTEAMDKCLCEFCVQSREWSNLLISQHIQLEGFKLFFKAIEESKNETS